MNEHEFFEVETMDDMVKRLAGTGGGEQVKAVLNAIKIIRQASGMLDKENTATVLYHLAAALTNSDHAPIALTNAAALGGVPANFKAAANLIEHAKKLVDQVVVGEKNPPLLPTASDHLRMAKRILNC